MATQKALTIHVPTPDIFSILKNEPAVVLSTLNGLLAILLAWGATSYNTRTVGIWLTVSTAVVALLVALLTRPASVPLLKGGIASLLVAFAAFGVHLPPVAIAGVAAIGSIFLGLLLRANLTPVAKKPLPNVVLPPTVPQPPVV